MFSVLVSATRELNEQVLRLSSTQQRQTMKEALAAWNGLMVSHRARVSLKEEDA